MTVTATKSVFWKGFRDGSPFVLGAMPFGLVFGVVATKAGLDIIEVMSMCFLVFAGAAQFTALAQMQDSASVFLVLVTALFVNLRTAMYSASLAPHLRHSPLWQRAFAAYLLVDNSYAVAFAEFENNPKQSAAAKMAYYLGCALPVWIIWNVAAFVGAYLGQSIPPDLALDFAMPIAFIAVVAPMLRSLAHVGAAMTSVIVALALASLPYSLGIFVAAIVAMVVGAEIERWMQRAIN